MSTMRLVPVWLGPICVAGDVVERSDSQLLEFLTECCEVPLCVFQIGTPRSRAPATVEVPPKQRRWLRSRRLVKCDEVQGFFCPCVGCGAEC